MGEIYGSGNHDSGGDGYRPPSANDGYRPPSSYDGYRPLGYSGYGHADQYDPGDPSDDYESSDSDPGNGLSRSEERERTWGSDLPDDSDEDDDFGAESDASIEARLDEAGLPTRAEARAAAWGPDATDEDDLDLEAAAAIEARLDEAGLPTRAEARAATDAALPRAETLSRREYLADIRSRPMIPHGSALQYHQSERRDNDWSPDTGPWRGPGRPDMAARSPSDYVRSSDEPPPVDRPHEHPERWIDHVNPGWPGPGRTNNCGECSRAVDSTWNGHPITAAALVDPESPGELTIRMTEWAGKAPAPASMLEIQKRLEDLGSGSSAIVGCSWKGVGGHWFNAVNDEGIVKAIDGQKGKVENWPPSIAGLGYDESKMRESDAIFFSMDGKVVME